MNDFNTITNDSSSLDELLAVRLWPELEQDTLAAIEVRLNSLPPRQTLTLTQALHRLAPAVKRLRANGYSVDEVATELTREMSCLGMTVSGRTLARLMPSKARTKAKAQRKARPCDGAAAADADGTDQTTS